MLHYQEMGGGVPLVILHGLFGSGDNWRSLAKDFAEHSRVILVDLPNHGNSPHTDDMRYPRMAEDLHRLTSELGLDSAFFLGHSMGGKVAMAYALTYPAAVRGLISADIAPKGYAPAHSEIIAAMQEVEQFAPQSRKSADDILAKRIAGKAIRAFLLKSLKPQTNGAYGWALNIGAIAECYPHLTSWPQLEGRYEGPALFVGGGKSDYIGEEDIGVVRKLFPRAVFESIDEAGHWLHVERREIFTELVIRFVSEYS